MYDWANSAFVLVVITAVFPIYFSNMAQAAGQSADEATANLSWATTIALVLTALLSPTLGALSDFLATRKKFLAISVLIGAGATATPGPDRRHLLVAAAALLLRPGQPRAFAQLRVLRRLPALHRGRGRARPGLLRRLRARLPRQLDPPGDGAGGDPVAPDLRPVRRRRRHPRRLRGGRRVVGDLFAAALPPGEGAAAPGRRRRDQRQERAGRHLPPPFRDLPLAAHHLQADAS